MVKKVTSRSDNQRQNLNRILPLSAPLSVYVQSSNVCNFKCNYCSQILDNSSLDAMQIKRKVMDYELFYKIAEQLKEFGGAIKTINLTGFGEPLLNNELHNMIDLCKKWNLSERVEVVTNGSLLNHELSNKLINSNLDLLRISIQGLSAKKYKEVSSVNIDFDKYVDNISYFYENKKNTRLYIKILDSAFEKNETEEDFYKIFMNICDNIAVEHLVPVMPGVDYSNMGSFDTGMTGYKNDGLMVCPRPFYMLTINTDGSVRPCCNYNPPMIIGNINNETIKEIWNGTKMKEFRIMMLEKTRVANSTCRTCLTPVYGLNVEDNIDSERNRLLDIYN
jgi:radical SAM protein with 4Fe4S-binding SPASM domain